MKHLFLLLCIWSTFFACSQNHQNEAVAYRWVEDIPFDSRTDDSSFQLCHDERAVFQYFNLSNGMLYKGEKKALIDEILRKYKKVTVDDSGWVRIRFVVNCKGETGRFRLISSDFSYQEKEFDTRITNQLLSITRSLKGWLPQTNDDFEQEAVDYYQYLIFKIQKGELTEIMP